MQSVDCLFLWGQSTKNLAPIIRVFVPIDVSIFSKRSVKCHPVLEIPGGAVPSVCRQKMHQTVGTIKDQVTAVEICCISKDGQGILFRTGPGALCPHRHRADAPLDADAGLAVGLYLVRHTSHA